MSNREDMEYEFWCPTCVSAQKIETTKREDGSGGVHRCSVCKTEFGVWINGRTLDLDLIRSLDRPDSDDFQVLP